MIDSKIIDDIAQKVSGLMPPGIKELQGDFEKNVQGIMQSVFAKMDLVTREEFDVQTDVLARTRSKLEAMEKTVAELEKKILDR